MTKGNKGLDFKGLREALSKGNKMLAESAALDSDSPGIPGILSRLLSIRQQLNIFVVDELERGTDIRQIHDALTNMCAMVLGQCAGGYQDAIGASGAMLNLFAQVFLQVAQACAERDEHIVIGPSFNPNDPGNSTKLDS